MAIDVGSIKATLTADAGGFTSALGSAGKGLAGFAQIAAKAATAAAAVGAAATAASIKVAGDFESSLVSAGAKAGATEQQLMQMKQAALEASGASEFSAKQAADALGFLAQAGFDVNQQMQALPGVLNLASAGELELAQAADIASNVLTGFGKSAAELNSVNDALVKTANSANTSVQQLGQAMSFAAPAAQGAGISLAETASIIGKLSDAGIQSGRAGRGFNAILGQMSKVAGDLGGKLSGAQIEALGFSGSLAKLREMGLSSRNAIELFGREAGPAIQALLSQGTASIDDLTASIEEAGGVAGDVAAKKIDTLNGAMNVLVGNVQNVAIKYGDAFLPALREIVPVISAFTQELVENEQLFRALTRSVVGTMPALAETVFIMGEMAATARLLGSSLELLVPTFKVVGAAATGNMALMQESMAELIQEGANFSGTFTEAKSEALDIQIKGREIAASLRDAAEAAQRNVDKMGDWADATRDVASEAEIMNEKFGAFPELPEGMQRIGGREPRREPEEPEPIDREAGLKFVREQTSREAQKLDAQRQNEEARRQTRLNALNEQGNQLADQRAEQQRAAMDRRRRMQNAEDQFAAAAERAFKARVQQIQQERQATKEMIGFASNVTGELAGLGSAIAELGGASSKAQQAIGQVGGLLQQGLGVAGNLSQGNIFGAITGGIGALASGVGFLGDMFGMGGGGAGRSRDRMSMEEFGRIAGEQIANQLEDRDLRPVEISFNARGAVTDSETVSRLVDGIQRELVNRGEGSL